MNQEQIKGNWMILKGKIKERWGKLTDDELDVADGRLDQVAGTVAKKYGIAKEKAHEQLDELCSAESSCH
ncbi:MAG: CsbD family protein [Planctomycetaceae bacterium]